MGYWKQKADEKWRVELLAALGKAIKEQRTALGYTQEQLAEIAGLDRAYVGALERGQRNISLTNLCLMANALAETPGSLLIEVNKVYKIR